MTGPTFRRRHLHLALLIAALSVPACGPGAGSETTPTPATGPLPGDNYALVYATEGGIRRQDTRTGTDTALLSSVDSLGVVAPSPDGHRVVVAYRGPDASRVVLIPGDSGAPRELHRGAVGARYTAAWSVDGERVGVGYRGPDGTGGILVLGPDGETRNIGCSAATTFAAWRAPTEVVVADAANYYTVRVSDCGTLATLPQSGKAGVIYARNGRRVAWFGDRKIGAGLIPELWIGDYTGANAKLIADFRSRPAHAVWAPDGRHIAYEVDSRRWANTTHIVIYDVPAGSYAYKAQEMPLGVPSDFGACWSANGEQIAHDRVYRRRSATQSYTTHQVVVRAGDREQVVFEEIIDRPAEAVQADPPPSCHWLGDHDLLVGSQRGVQIVAVDGHGAYQVPSNQQLLTAVVFPGPPAP